MIAAIIAARKAKFHEKKGKGKSENSPKRVSHKIANEINELFALEESSDEDVDPALAYYEGNGSGSETDSDSEANCEPNVRLTESRNIHSKQDTSDSDF